jgi:hypothetical protein
MDLSVELAIARAMANELESYLLSNQLFRQLVVRTPLGDLQPKMTLGAFSEHLRALRRREASLVTEQRATLDEIGKTWETMRRRYAERYADLLRQELRSQLDSWTWFLEDCLKRPGRCRDDYPTEARIRARIALLLEELGSSADIRSELARLASLDERLRRIWQKDRFLWPGESANVYPPDRYWFLYGYPQGEDED